MNRKMFASALATVALVAAAGCAMNRAPCCETGPCGRLSDAPQARGLGFGLGPGGGACVLNQNAPVNPTGTITPSSADENACIEG